MRYLMQRPGSVSGNMSLRLECMRRIVATHAPAVTVVGGAEAVRYAQAHRGRRKWSSRERKAATLPRGRAVDLRALLAVPSMRSARFCLRDLVGPRQRNAAAGEPAADGRRRARRVSTPAATPARALSASLLDEGGGVNLQHPRYAHGRGSCARSWRVRRRSWSPPPCRLVPSRRGWRQCSREGHPGGASQPFSPRSITLGRAPTA